jgi:hypothetical protein
MNYPILLRTLFFNGRAAAVLLTAAVLGPAAGQQPAPTPAPESCAPTFNPRSTAVRPPTATLDASAQTTIPLLSTVPIFNPAYPPAPSGGGWYPGWGWGLGGPGTNAYYGYLQGAADLTVANAQYQLTIQQARIVREQANREAIATRRATLQQRQYEREEWLKNYDPEVVRQRDSEWNLRRSLNDPPSAEIWSGDALNSLLKDIQKGEAFGVRVPPVPLDSEVLQRINLTTGTTTAGVGMLKDLTRFNWPLPLRRGAFKKEREQIEEMARTAVDQAMSSNIDADLLDKLNEAVESLVERVKGSAPDMTPTQYVQVTRYLRELKDSLKVLQDPNVANYFNSRYRAQGDTVLALVQNMSTRGLRFAPAASGDEPSYTALHRALVTYDYRLHMAGAR